MIRAIAFDWGGVFTEGTFDESACRALSEASGRSVAAIEPSYRSLMAEFEVGAFGLSGFHERFCAATGTTAELPFARFEATFLGAVRERSAMYAVLGAIPTGDYVVGMLSNNVPVLADRVRNDLRMQRIEHWVFSHEIGVRKPDPRAYQALSDALGVPPEATVFIDDAERNVAAARSAGFKTIHMTDLGALLSGWRALLPNLDTGIDEHA